MFRSCRITSSPGIWMIFFGSGCASICSGPSGRQRASGLSLASCSRRSSRSLAAQGRYGGRWPPRPCATSKNTVLGVGPVPSPPGGPNPSTSHTPREIGLTARRCAALARTGWACRRVLWARRLTDSESTVPTRRRSGWTRGLLRARVASRQYMLHAMTRLRCLLIASSLATVVGGLVQGQAPAPKFLEPSPVPPLFFREPWRQSRPFDASTGFRPEAGVTAGGGDQSPTRAAALRSRTRRTSRPT